MTVSDYEQRVVAALTSPKPIPENVANVIAEWIVHLAEGNETDACAAMTVDEYFLSQQEFNERWGGHMMEPELSPRVLCSKCGKDTVLVYDDPATAVCPECCEDHEYIYDRGDRKHYCKNCGGDVPYDFYDHEP